MFYFVFARTVDIVHGNNQLASGAYIIGPMEGEWPGPARDVEIQWQRFNSLVGAKHARNKINKAGRWL